MSKISTTHSTKLQDTNGSSRGLNTASMPADRAQANHEVGKVPKPITESLWDTPARKLGKALSRMSSRQKQPVIKLLVQENSKLQDVIVYTDGSVSTSHCQARCNYHLWRWCSLHSLNLQPNNGSGSSHPCPPLDCIKRWQSDHTCYHPHRFNELAPKSEKWNGKPRLECVNSWHPPSKTPVDILPWTCQSEGKWQQKDCWAKQPSQVACFLEDLNRWEAQDTSCEHKAMDITPLIAWWRLKRKC